MKTVTIPAQEIKIYKFEELSDKAKEKVRESFMQDEIYNELFAENIIEILKTDYPDSDLNIQYSLGYCQGDGFNIYGKLGKKDILKIYKESYLKPTEKQVKTIAFYIDNEMNIELERNNSHYEYSCKFNQLRYIEDETDGIIDNLKDYFRLRQINGEIINDCLMAVYKHFQKLDKEFEKKGYKCLYEFSDERIKEECDANEWEYTEDGELYLY